MITRIIGQRAIAKPSNAALAMSLIGICHFVMARMALMTSEPIAALKVGHLKTVKATTNHNMGRRANRKFKNSKISPLLSISNQTVSIIRETAGKSSEKLEKKQEKKLKVQQYCK